MAYAVHKILYNIPDLQLNEAGDGKFVASTVCIYVYCGRRCCSIASVKRAGRERLWKPEVLLCMAKIHSKTSCVITDCIQKMTMMATSSTA